MNIFFAHSTARDDKRDWQTLKAHLRAVAEGAGERAEKFGAPDYGRAAGLLHDLGKYSEPFQRRLEGSGPRVDHSTAGAKVAVERWGRAGKLLAFVIAGHHAGLANGTETGERSTLEERLKRSVPALNPAWAAEIDLPTSLAPPPLKAPPDEAAFAFALFSRMLFSCLVDADRLDTEAFYAHLDGQEVERFGHSSRETRRALLENLREKLDAHLATIEARAGARLDPKGVNARRAEILAHVRGKAGERPGLFSLTVPTGGGKTLASLVFALDHAIRHDLDRVIYVIPFTSIVEQNAGVFRDALGPHAVLEHHSAFDDEALLRAFRQKGGEAGPEGAEKLRLAAETWDAPVVVTTAVQFFESLFSDRTSKCRKLHNIARSVVILDEAQTLPLPLLRPCVSALKELARNYGASIVLCTATQPALNERADEPKRSFAGGFRDVRELAPEPPKLYEALKRVTVKHAGIMDDDELAAELREHRQVLCIVNSRAHARELHRRIADDASSARHLTTLMCAAHRSEALAEIRERLAAGEPCRVIATSLVEAGVDVDFPTVFRGAAGIDSIAQAAGRCNREGRNAPEDSHVVVFEAPDWPAPAELTQFAAVGRGVLRRHEDDPLSLDAVRDYFEHLYWQRGAENLDAKDILGRLRERKTSFDFPFETIGSIFRMIESGMRPVIVPYDAEAEGHIRALRHAERIGGIARQLQRYLVQVPPKALASLVAAGAMEAIRPAEFGDQFMILNNRDLYRPDTGLEWTDPTFREVESTIF